MPIDRWSRGGEGDLLKTVTMRNVTQRWRTLSSRAFQILFKRKTPWGRSEIASVNVVKVRGLIYPMGREPDRDEFQGPDARDEYV